MKYYLATTGISEIWDLDTNLLFLGPWCLTEEKNKKIIDNKKYLVIDSPWKPTHKIKEACDYCQNIYEDLLSQLAESLNAVHHVSYPLRYWQVLLGPWLLSFIGIFYDRYTRIKNAFEMFPDCYTHALVPEQGKILFPNTFDSLTALARDDLCNLKLFSFLLYNLYPKNIKEIQYNLKTEIITAKFNTSWKGRLFNLFLMTLSHFSNSYLILSEMQHLRLSDLFLLSLKSRQSRLIFINFTTPNTNHFKDKFSLEFRKSLIIKGWVDRFHELLYKIIPYAIPICYMENYKTYRADILKYLDSAKAVGSIFGWFLNDKFKFFAAEAASRGAKLIYFQHGGIYGTILAHPYEAIALEKDIFYTWGWNSKIKNNIRPFPSFYLSRIKDTHSARYNKILFIGMAIPRYTYFLHTILTPDDMAKYFMDKIFFLKSLAKRLQTKIIYRPYFDHGWHEKEFIKEAYPDIEIAVKDTVVKWMQRVKLVVIDHPHSSFLEALVINVPMVLYWDHEVYLMRPEAEEYFELLRKVGILYRDPLSAAKKVNEIFFDPRSWWLSDDVQNARFKFCERFAYARKDWVNIWVQEFKNLQFSLQ